MRVPLLGGAYSAQSIIADAQRCINLYPERNQKDALSPVTHYPTPGLVAFGQGVAGPGRGLYRASNEVLYGVIGARVYAIGATGALQLLGQIPFGTTPVSMQDNGTELLLANGTKQSWLVTLSTGAFRQNPDGNFESSGHLGYLDTFMLATVPGTKKFTSSLSNEMAWDPTYVASKTASPDLLQSLAVVSRELLLIGQLTTELWYDVGNAGFPFAAMPMILIQHGTCAPWSVAQSDRNVYMVSQDPQGQGMVVKIVGYAAQRVSNHALENAMRQMPTLVDAVAFTYQQNGHEFLQVTFPSGDQTWVFDDSTQEWHQRAWTDPQGCLHRHRVQWGAFAYGKNLGLDWENGQVYELSLDAYTDVGAPVRRVRGFPHMFVGIGPNGPIAGDGKLVRWDAFIADMEVGTADGTDYAIGLRWSNDRGRTFGNPVMRSLGAQGQYLTSILWRNTGIARDRVFELSWSAPLKTALNGAFVSPTVLGK